MSERLRKVAVIGLLGWFVAASGAYADHVRFHLEGKKLFYNSSITSSRVNVGDIVDDDADELALYIMDEPQIDTLVLESEGGSTWAALRMGETIQRFGLRTEVQNACYSACPLVFLAGEPRNLARGGVLGFHRSSIEVFGTRVFFETGRGKNIKSNRFEYVYEDAVSTAVETYTYMLRRGVEPAFILQVMGTPAREMLYPSRQELISASIIDE